MRSQVPFHCCILSPKAGFGNQEIREGDGLVQYCGPDSGWHGEGEASACTRGRRTVQDLHGGADYSGRLASPGNDGSPQVPVNQMVAEFPQDLALTVLRYVSRET